MSRAERLLGLIDELRKHHYAVTAHHLADATGVSLRTLYRDIGSLRSQGAPIEGEGGVGYILKPGFMLPPLMFPEAEIEALAVGARWVIQRTDPELAEAAKSALARIGAVLPRKHDALLQSDFHIVGPSAPGMAATIDIAVIRKSIRRERKLILNYADGTGNPTKRVIWPFLIGYFGQASLVAGWCELRNGIRHFRTDRIGAVTPTDERYPNGRHALVKLWHAGEKHDE
jgi:predicted DNA-binding transcriptional regulator YafY